MEETHAALAARVRQPKATAFGKGYVFRYQEQDVHQAIVQKLARVISGLHAARLLLAHGYLQELGALKRMLDEFNEDVLFLTYGVVSGETTEEHRQYLEAFFQEEFDNPGSAMDSTQKRPMVPRRKIRAYLSRIKGAGLDPSNGVEVRRTVEKLYSGFVHGASPHIMEMYDGEHSAFQVRGTPGTNLADEHREDLWNYFYRAIASFAWSAKAFGDDTLFQEVLAYMREFARANGQDNRRPPTKPRP